MLWTVNIGTCNSISYNYTTLNTGLCAYYNFDQNSLNALGNGFNLVPTSGVQFLTGIISSSVYLSGANNIVGPNLKTSTTGPLVSGTAISISAWVKTSLSGGFVVNSVTGNRWTGGGYQLNIGNGRATFSLFDGKGTSNLGGTNYLVNGVKFVSDNNWHHIVGTFANGIMNLYVDGVLDATTNASALTAYGGNGVNTLCVGNNSDASFPPGTYTGFVDAVGLWNRALSASEISALYNNGSGLQYPFPYTA